MCNRFRAIHAYVSLWEHFQAWDEIEEYVPRFNIAPTQPILTVREVESKREFVPMRWGLIPHWASAPTTGNFNARSESVTSTPSFKDAVLSRRCLIPADGFYEWKKMGAVKQPYCFEVGEGEIFAFAGLWDAWRNPGGEPTLSCTILTTAANSLVGEIHDRMPVILSPENYSLWMNPEPHSLEAALQLLKPFDSAAMRRYPVNPKLNNSQNEDASDAAPITLDVPVQGDLF